MKRARAAHHQPRRESPARKQCGGCWEIYIGSTPADDSNPEFVMWKHEHIAHDEGR